MDATPVVPSPAEAAGSEAVESGRVPGPDTLTVEGALFALQEQIDDLQEVNAVLLARVAGLENTVEGLAEQVAVLRAEKR